MPSEMENARLAKLAQDGCADAFTELVRRNQSRLLSFLSFYCRDRHTLEDAAQEAFLQAYLHLEQFDPTRNFTTWLFTIARRLLQKRRAISLADDALLTALPSRDAGPPQRLDAREQRDWFWRRIRQVTDDDEFQLLWMFYAEELPLDEIAGSLKLAYATCKKRLSRLRQRLRTQLDMNEQMDVNEQDAQAAIPLRRAS